MNLNDALSFSEVYSTVKYLRARDVMVDDVKCFNQFCNLKTFVEVFRTTKISKVRRLVISGLNTFRRVVTHTAIPSSLK
jgi:hypothetical protein